MDARRRAQSLDAAERELFDIGVIGGGITGAGVAREAAMRGLSVVLLEARDFAAGTSSRSSKLIHGGLRYLSMGDIALVRATARERKVVRRMAPHLAEPRWMLLPVRTRAGVLKFRTGIGTYEKLGAVEKPDRHRLWSKAELEREEPLLDRERFGWACAYREYLTEDARLVLANLRAAVSDGARVVNHLAVDSIPLEGGRAAGLEGRCALSGRRVRVRCRAVVNAAGPWVDAVVRLEEPKRPVRLHLSKGIHVVIPATRLPVRHMVVLQPSDGRSIFAIRRGDSVWIGTTDTSYPAEPTTWPRIERSDVEYLLAPVNRDFAVEPLGLGDVVAAWAGLRPLIAEPGKSAHEISRKDEVWIGSANVTTIAGGKLTGYRTMARTALERAAEVSGSSPAPAPQEEPGLPGSDGANDLDALAQGLARAAPQVPEPTAARLARLYGSEASSILALGAEPLVPGGRVVTGEVDWAVGHEAACTLEDLLYRRTRVAVYAPAECDSLVDPAARRMGELLGWSEEQREKEAAGVRTRRNDDLGFQEPT
jgi:glycerol-3-phosphate dehydrogenase